MVLPLQVGILYGPVNSRRLGKSLGVNLMPASYKLCSFNCVYCHYGWTKKRTLSAHECMQDLPTFHQVAEALERAARSALEFDYLTFSGNGEPTLHPQFADLVYEAARIRSQYRPGVRIALLSNSTGLRSEQVRRSIAELDVPVFKLDAGTEGTFKAINRPAAGVDFKELVDLLSSLHGIYLQSVLIDGSPGNVRPEQIEAYLQLIARIRPVEAHIYSTDRPVPHSGVRLVPPEKLEQMAALGEKETGVAIRAFYPR